VIIIDGAVAFHLDFVNGNPQQTFWRPGEVAVNSQTRSKLVFCALMTGLLSVQSASGAAGRSVRSDSSDSAFDFLGGFWGTDLQGFGPGFDAGKTDFKLRINPNESAHFFKVCMSEDGFVKLIGATATCANTDYALGQTKAYIAVFATNLDSSSGFLFRTRGFVDPVASTTQPFYHLWEAKPAMRFWWNGVTLAGDFNAFDVQIVLIDRSNGTNNGNFDIEFNYGNGSDQVPPLGTSSNGFQGFKLGPNSRGPIAGPFGPFLESGEPIRFCFRGGSLLVTCN